MSATSQPSTTAERIKADEEKAKLSKWSPEAKAKMSRTFEKFRRKKAEGSINWTQDALYTSIFDEDIDEKGYWNLRFDIEYNRVKDMRPSRNLQRLADLHAYIFFKSWVSMLGSHDYPDDFNCLSLLS